MSKAHIKRLPPQTHAACPCLFTIIKIQINTTKYRWKVWGWYDF